MDLGSNEKLDDHCNSMDFPIVESIEYITSANHGAGGAGPWFNVPTLGDFVATVGK